MSSWPGFLRPHSELVGDSIQCATVRSHHHGITLQVPFAECPWSDHRSEIYVQKSASTRSFVGQGNGVYDGAILLSSTELETISLLHSELSLPRTTSTVPIHGYKTTERKRASGDTDDPTRPLIKNQQRERSPSSSQHSGLDDHAVSSVQDNSAKLSNLLHGIINLHEKVSAKRYRTRDLRHALRQKREEEHALRLTLRNSLNLVFPDSVLNEVSAISNAIQNLQAVTSSYLVLEEEYHKFEDELGQQEYLMEKRMTELNNALCNQTPSLTRQARVFNFGSGCSSEYASDGGIDIPPIEADYLSIVGDARMLRERLAELERQYHVILDQRELRERIDISLDAETLASLDGYED